MLPSELIDKRFLYNYRDLNDIYFKFSYKMISNQFNGRSFKLSKNYA